MALFFCLLVRKSVNSSIEFNILFNRKIFIQRKFLAHVANIFFDLLRLFKYIVPCYHSLARGWYRKAAEHTHSGSFTGAICAQKTKYLTFANLECYFIHGHKIAKALGELICLYYRFLAHSVLLIIV